MNQNMSNQHENSSFRPNNTYIVKKSKSGGFIRTVVLLSLGAYAGIYFSTNYEIIRKTNKPTTVSK